VVVATVPGAGDHQLGPRRNAGPARPAGHPRRAAGPCRRARRRRRHTAQRRRGALLRRGPGRRRRHRAPARPDGASPGGPSPGVVAVRRRWLLDRGLRPRDPQHRPARGRRRARGRGPRRPSRGWSPTATPAPMWSTPPGSSPWTTSPGWSATAARRSTSWRCPAARQGTARHRHLRLHSRRAGRRRSQGGVLRARTRMTASAWHRRQTAPAEAMRVIDPDGTA
jgi:hypothetical protein